MFRNTLLKRLDKLISISQPGVVCIQIIISLHITLKMMGNKLQHKNTEKFAQT